MDRRTLAIAVIGLAGLAACEPSSQAPDASGGTRAKPKITQPHSVLLITVDTLRADHVRAYGSDMALTPAIDALAARGVLFENVIAAASVTAPSHASILTSRFPREHTIGTVNGTTRLEGGETLAERFRAAGYATAAFVGNFVLRPVIGLDRGFAVYDADLPTTEPNRSKRFERNAEATARRALAWLRTPRQEPFFLWVQFQDPHGPYTPPAAFLDATPPPAGESRDNLPALDQNSGTGGIPRYQQLAGVDRTTEYKRRYAAEVAYADHWIGRLLEAAEIAAGERGLVILLTADHGESLGEAGFYFQHGHATTPELALAPLVISAPGLAPARRSDDVHHVDVMPTALALAGLPVPDDASGLSLVPFLESGDPLPERVLFCDIGRETGAYAGDTYLRVRGSLLLWGTWAAGRADRAAGRADAAAGQANRAAGRAERTGDPPDDLLVLEGYRYDDRGWNAAPADPLLLAKVKDYLESAIEVVWIDEPSEDDKAQLRALGYLPAVTDAAQDEAFSQ